MKNFAWTVFLAFCLVYLAGCAIPEKPRVSQPPLATPSDRSPAVTGPEMGPAGVEQPNYLNIDDQSANAAGNGITEVELPSTEYINDRIFEYGRKLDRWKALDSEAAKMQLKAEDAAQMVSCFRRLQDVLNGYSDLRSRMLQAQQLEVADRISNAEMYELQKKDIAFLEDTCGHMLAESGDKSIGWNKREEGADLGQLETLIERYAASREYEELIQVWLKIPESQRTMVHLRARILYGNALMYLHQEEKAAEVYQQVVNKMTNTKEQATDLVSLRKVLADLYTASGNYGRAADEYKKISEDYANIGHLEEWSKLQLAMLDRSKTGGPELQEFSAMLRNYLGFIPERDGYKIVWQAEKFQAGYPYSPVASNVEIIRASVQQAADKWFNGYMAEVDKLAKEKKFSDALKLLEKIPADIVGEEKQPVIKAKKDELVLAEAVEKETDKMAKMQDLQNQWNNGLLLANGGRFDEAIDVFKQLQGTDYSDKAQAKIEELSLEAAKADRRKAADLFIRFTKTDDLESKKKLLVETRRLLRGILEKYPQVEIAQKVAGNIDRVEQEMRAIDPTLLLTTDQSEAAAKDNATDAFDMPTHEPMTGIQVPSNRQDQLPVRQQ